MHTCLNGTKFYTAPLYDNRKISLCICIHSIQCLIDVILTYDFICIFILSLSLESPLCSYLSSYQHYLYRCVMFYVSLSYLCTCCVFIHLCIESRGLVTFLVLMLFVLQCTTINKIFLLLLLLFQSFLLDHVWITVKILRHVQNFITITSLQLG